jgi:acyl-CoA thioester hydrolase
MRCDISPVSPNCRNRDALSEILGIEVMGGVVEPAWIDINRHMNVACYVLVFDRAVDEFFSSLGITREYIESRRGSTFAVECHVTYQRELCDADPYRVTVQILAYDAKRIHQFQRLYHAREGYLAATAEWMNLHVDLSSRRVSPWPDIVLAKLETFAGRQTGMAVPLEAGRSMRVERPLYTLHGDRR